MVAEAPIFGLTTRNTFGSDEQSDRQGAGLWSEDPLPSLDYAAFVLEQEAAYCQQ